MPAYGVRGRRADQLEVVDLPMWAENPDPDLYTSFDEFLHQVFWDYQHGEVIVWATARYSDGYPARFHVLSPWLVNIELVDGIRRYNVGNIDITDNVLHIRYQSRTDDARGHGPLEAAGLRVTAARALALYATNTVKSGGIPNYVIKHPRQLSAKQTNQLLEQWWTSRMSNIGLPAVLTGGVELEQMQISPRDMALVELEQYNASRIADLLRVPPFLVGLPSGGDSMTYSNVSSLFDYHWRAGLRPKAQRVMNALSQWLLPYGTRVELDRDEYVRPALPELANAYAVLHGITDETGRVLTAAQIRALQRMPGQIGAAPTPALPQLAAFVPNGSSRESVTA
jgi:HK97 family phage portal protein